MTLPFEEIGYLLLLYLPVGALILWFYLKRRKQNRKRLRLSKNEKTTRRREQSPALEELNEKMDPWLMQIVTVPLLLAVLLILTKSSLVAVIVYFLLSAGLCAVAVFQASAADSCACLLPIGISRRAVRR